MGRSINLEGKVAMVTGASSGLGQRFAQVLSEAGAKIVLASRGDYEWARAMLTEHALTGRCMVLFSPVHGAVEPRELAEWILADKLDVRFQLQLHKRLWNDAKGK